MQRGQSLRRSENKRKPNDDKAGREKRQRKGKDEVSHQTKSVPARDAQIQKEAESIGHRSTLELPAAQFGKAKLEDIVKIGQAGELARSLGARMIRTPRVAPQRELSLLPSPPFDGGDSEHCSRGRFHGRGPENPKHGPCAIALVDTRNKLVLEDKAVFIPTLFVLLGTPGRRCQDRGH